MADNDPSRFDEVRDWTLRDLFVAYLDRVKDRARSAYETDMLMWAILAAGGAKVKPPDPPAVLGISKMRQVQL